MKLTAPQMRMLTNIITDPTTAQIEIDSKLSARNVFDNLVKVGALVEIAQHDDADRPVVKRNLLNTRVTKEAYDKAGVMLNVNEISETQRGILADVIDTDPIADSEPTMLPSSEDMKRLNREAPESNPVPEYKTPNAVQEKRERFGRVVTITPLPMPEIDPADEPIPFIPAQRSLDFAGRAVTLALPLKIKNLMVGTGEIGSIMYLRNAHRATEDMTTGKIVCECNIRTKSRKLLAQLHKTTRIIPTVTEV